MSWSLTYTAVIILFVTLLQLFLVDVYFCWESAIAIFQTCRENFAGMLSQCERRNRITELQKDWSCWESFKTKTERCLICRSGDLRVVCMLMCLHKDIPVFLKFGGIVSNAHENVLIGSIGLVVHLGTIRCRCWVFQTAESTSHNNNFCQIKYYCPIIYTLEIRENYDIEKKIPRCLWLLSCML